MLLGNDIEGCQLFYFLEGLSPEKKSLCSCGFFRDRKKKEGDQMRELWLLEEGGLQCSRKLDGA
jgi:hypothetical protein